VSHTRGLGASLLFIVCCAPVAAEDAPRLRLDIEASYSDLSHDLESWTEGSARAAYQADEDLTLAAALEVASRFENFDAYLEGRADYRVAPGVWAYALAGGTPDADFRPRFAAGAGGSARLFQDDGMLAAAVTTVDARYADYLSGDVQTLNPGLELYLLKGRAFLTFRQINIWDETDRHRSGYLLRTDVEPWRGVTVVTGYSDAPDTSGGVTVDVRAWFTGLALDLDDSKVLRAAIGQDLRETGYDRTTFSLSLTLRR
jgi:YaiO family outer membrane protein